MARIAIHLPDLRGGGAERVMTTLANEFADRNHDVELVLSRAEGHHLQNAGADVDVVDLGARRLPGYAALGALWPLRRYLQREEPDVLLSGIARANIVALLAHRLASTDTRIVVSEHNTLSSWIADEKGLRMAAVPQLVRFTYRWADDIIAVSDGVGDDLAATAGIPRERIRTIYNPVVTDELYEDADEPPPHPWFEGDPPVVLGAGSLTSQKDFPTLIRAFEMVRDERYAKLIITGKGPERDQLQSLIDELQLEEDAMLVGFVDNPYPYINHASVFVLSSKYEGLPTVLIEALACGTPIVATDCPSGPRDILQDGTYGPLVPVSDEQSLAEAIIETLDDPLQSSHLTRRGENFESDKVVDEYVSVLLPSEE